MPKSQRKGTRRSKSTPPLKKWYESGGSSYTPYRYIHLLKNHEHITSNIIAEMQLRIMQEKSIEEESNAEMIVRGFLSRISEALVFRNQTQRWGFVMTIDDKDFEESPIREEKSALEWSRDIENLVGTAEQVVMLLKHRHHFDCHIREGVFSLPRSENEKNTPQISDGDMNATSEESQENQQSTTTTTTSVSEIVDEEDELDRELEDVDENDPNDMARALITLHSEPRQYKTKRRMEVRTFIAADWGKQVKARLLKRNWKPERQLVLEDDTSASKENDE